MEAAKFDSVRGAFKFGPNHFPIHNVYQQEAYKSADGGYDTRTVSTILTAYQDSHAAQCKMQSPPAPHSPACRGLDPPAPSQPHPRPPQILSLSLFTPNPRTAPLGETRFLT